MADVVLGHRFQQLDRGLDLVVGEVDRTRDKLFRRTRFVVPCRRMRDDHVTLDPQQAEPLSVGPRELRDRHLRAALQRHSQRLVRFRRHLAIGLEVVAVAHPVVGSVSTCPLTAFQLRLGLRG
jgi:hypothetical protein